MKNQKRVEDFIDFITNGNFFPNKKNLKFHLDSIFFGIDFNNKNFLDIGGGIGLHSFYAAIKGAKQVLCLEPEADGSGMQMNEKFNYISKALNFDNVVLMNSTFQSYSFQDKYDIISLHNSINHLDEQSCVNLLTDKISYENYQKIFRKIYDIANKNAILIICDCSNSNFFAKIRTINPFAPNIEWSKHQSPEIWSSLLKEVGFTNPKIKWSSFNRLGSTGRFFLGNRFMAFFLQSHFCLMMNK
ncbi:MAG TPA: class I SAM-dependent methyltransferase [Ignavibacteria bacterium]